jgi:hypothetical protein
MDLKQHLPGTWRRDGSFLKTKIAWLRAVVRSCSEDYLASDCFGHVDLSFSVESPSIECFSREPVIIHRLGFVCDNFYIRFLSREWGL